MPRRDGELGILKQNGEQVAGFTSWHIDLNIQFTVQGGWKKRKPGRATAKARKYWLCSQPEGNKFQAEFYQVVKDQLVLVTSQPVACELPELEIDNLINKPIEMIWMN